MTDLPEGRLDRASIEALYRTHAAELRRFLTGVLRDPEAAADALHNTFVKAIEKGHTADRDALKGWLFKVAWHEAMALRRRESLNRRAQPKLLDLNRLKPANRKPDDRISHDETLIRTRQAIEHLPDEQKHVLNMRLKENKTFARIAKDLGIPIGTALTRMRLALQKLRGEIEQ